VVLLGGWTAVASELGLRTRRGPYGAMQDLDTAAAALLAYILDRHNKGTSPGADTSLPAEPTHTQDSKAKVWHHIET
jgi:hypothetical protein